MRFSKRVKLGKGLNMNLSKSGAGLSIGGRGASLSFGKNGLYLNTGIPGTGISHRQKIGGSSRRSATRNTVKVQIKFYIEMDDENNPMIKWGVDNKFPNGMITKKGEIIKDESLLRQIKRSDVYKKLLKEAAEEKATSINNETEIPVYAFKKSSKVVELNELQKELEKIKSPLYRNNLYEEIKPQEERYKLKLENEAKNTINSILFWTNKKKRQEYCELNFNKIFPQALKEWKEKCNAIDVDLDEISTQLELSINGDENYINTSIQRALENIELPVEISADFEYIKNRNLVKIDLDLPEIEDLPTQVASVTARNKISIKKKTHKRLKEEYARCVTGLAFYISANIFNISPTIDVVQISGYTQRLSKKSGHVEDQYVYSIIMDRSSFKKLNITKIDPLEAFENFDHKMTRTASFELKTITPYE